MSLNAAWHRRHHMPKRATLEQRLMWHHEHQRHCGCRPDPDSLAPAKSELRRLLADGDRRSLTQASSALALLARDPSRMLELVSLLRDPNPLVVQRALDTVEKVARRNVAWVQPLRKLFLGPIVNHERWEVRLQLVRLLPLLRWTTSQRARVLQVLHANVRHPRALVRASALDGLALLASEVPSQRAQVERLARELAAGDSKVVQARARHVLASLERAS